jgi:ribosome modulation factor
MGEESKMSGPRIRLDDKAYDAGFAAGEAGEFSGSCPYPAMTIESLSWHSGFIEGKAKRIAASSPPARR